MSPSADQENVGSGTPSQDNLMDGRATKEQSLKSEIGVHQALCVVPSVPDIYE